MDVRQLFKTLLLAVMGFGLFSCSSDEDEPRTPGTEEGPGNASIPFESKVKGRMWVVDDYSTVMGDGTEYDVLIMRYLCGESPLQINAFFIDGEKMSYFWTPTAYHPDLNYYSREDITYVFDPLTNKLDLNNYRAHKMTFTILSVSDEELVLAGLYGITPKDFNPEKYDDAIFGDGNYQDINERDMDPDSYIKLTFHVATPEEAADIWEKHKENK